LAKLRSRETLAMTVRLFSNLNSFKDDFTLMDSYIQYPYQSQYAPVPLYNRTLKRITIAIIIVSYIPSTNPSWSWYLPIHFFSRPPEL